MLLPRQARDRHEEKTGIPETIAAVLLTVFEHSQRHWVAWAPRLMHREVADEIGVGCVPTGTCRYAERSCLRNRLRGTARQPRQARTKLSKVLLAEGTCRLRWHRVGGLKPHRTIIVVRLYAAGLLDLSLAGRLVRGVALARTLHQDGLPEHRHVAQSRQRCGELGCEDPENGKVLKREQRVWIAVFK